MDKIVASLVKILIINCLNSIVVGRVGRGETNCKDRKGGYTVHSMDGFSLWFSQCLAMLHPKSTIEGRDKGPRPPIIRIWLCVFQLDGGANVGGGNITVSVSV